MMIARRIHILLLALGLSPAAQAQTSMAAFGVAELGRVEEVGALAGFGGEVSVAFARLEARGAFTRLGSTGGCMPSTLTSCWLRDVQLWEVGLGVVLGAPSRLDGWVAGIGLGRATEELDEARATLSAYLTRSWRFSEMGVLRAEGRFRSLKASDGHALNGFTFRLGAGISFPS